MGSYISNYHTITARTTPVDSLVFILIANVDTLSFSKIFFIDPHGNKTFNFTIIELERVVQTSIKFTWNPYEINLH